MKQRFTYWAFPDAAERGIRAVASLNRLLSHMD